MRPAMNEWAIFLGSWRVTLSVLLALCWACSLVKRRLQNKVSRILIPRSIISNMAADYEALWREAWLPARLEPTTIQMAVCH